ncbi:MAG: type II toxin-antitoxin system HicB family antitoxin [Defluviitaleaceae bacterium]|nr:type II toxin-antitoxin system HicB family antitoxin [Defluviitaleaceae bacterium]
MKYVYPAVFEPATEGGYVVSFPDLRGCYSQGETVCEALSNAQSALAQWLEYLTDKKQEIPKVSSMKSSLLLAVILFVGNIGILPTSANTTHTVTFTAGANGSITATRHREPIASPANIESDSTIIFTATPNEGFIIAGWTITGGTFADNISENTRKVIVSDNISVNVTFEPVHTVTFDLNGGNINSNTENIVEKNIAHATSATTPENPLRSGWIFGGWDTDFTNITDNTLVRAQWLRLGALSSGGMGDVSSAEIVFLARAIAVHAGFVILDNRIADINGDGVVDSADITAFLRWLTGYCIECLRGKQHLTFKSSEGGSINIKDECFFAYSEIELEATAEDGYFFAGWETSNGGYFEYAPLMPLNIFHVPENATNITANFVYMSDVDTDEDGLPDWYEELFGTDPNNPDTDGDSLPDGYEVFVSFTDPLQWDSLGDGISDGGRDSDGDGLTNYEEFLLGTNPHDPDTDNDGLTDYEEIHIYATDPLNPDTDNDGLTDYEEIHIFALDPLNPSTLGDGVLDGVRKMTTVVEAPDLQPTDKAVPSLSIDLPAQDIDKVSLNRIPENNIFLTPNIPGYTGSGFELKIDTEFESATLTFELDPDLFNDPDFDPAIFLWDEETQQLIDVSEFIEGTSLEHDTIQGQSVVSTLTFVVFYYKFATDMATGLRQTYMVMDRRARHEALMSMPTAPIQAKNVDLVVMLEDATMFVDNNDFEEMRQFALEVVNSLEENDRVAVALLGTNSSVAFNERFRDHNPQRANAIEYLENLTRRNLGSGGACSYNGLFNALTDLRSANQENQRAVLLLTSGHYVPGNPDYQAYAIGEMQGRGSDIIVHTVLPNFYPSVAPQRMRELAEISGGAMVNLNADGLDVIIEHFAQRAGLDLTDTDGDGVPDVYEQMVANGELFLSSGELMPGYNLLDYTNADSDGDGLLDGEEIEIRFMTVDDELRPYIFMHSTPTLADSDGDGIPDMYDFVPLNPHNNHPTVFEWSRRIGDGGAHYYPLAVTPLQTWLEDLGFLNMYDRSTGERLPFGTYGGLTRGAVVTFQLNFGFEPTGEMDSHTYLAVLNAWVRREADIHGLSDTSAASLFNSNIPEYMSQQFDILGVTPRYKSGLVPLAPDIPQAMKDLYVTVEMLDGWYYYNYTIPLNALMLGNKQVAHLYADIISSPTYFLVWFREHVKSGGLWDVKLQHRWEAQLPNITYLTNNGKFILRGELTDAEGFGNIHFGYIGASLLYGRNFLNWGADVAAGGADDPHDTLDIDIGINYYWADVL